MYGCRVSFISVAIPLTLFANAVLLLLVTFLSLKWATLEKLTLFPIFVNAVLMPSYVGWNVAALGGNAHDAPLLFEHDGLLYPWMLVDAIEFAGYALCMLVPHVMLLVRVRVSWIPTLAFWLAYLLSHELVGGGYSAVAFTYANLTSAPGQPQEWDIHMVLRNSMAHEDLSYNTGL